MKILQKNVWENFLVLKKKILENRISNQLRLNIDLFKIQI